jgi:hypothetical protein
VQARVILLALAFLWLDQRFVVGFVLAAKRPVEGSSVVLTPAAAKVLAKFLLVAGLILPPFP